MSDLLVLTFADPEEAAKVRETFVGLHRSGALELVDTVIISQGADGKPQLVGDPTSGAKRFGTRGAIVGGLLAVALPGVGLVLGAAAGLATGAFAGGVLGASTIDQQFVDEVKGSMQPGTSALFVVYRSAKTGVVAGALRPYAGKVLQTTLPDDVEEAIGKALE